jgi:NADH-quinone oxidoreductase subunit E
VSRDLASSLEKGIRDILVRYPTKQAALLPVLHLVQRERGFISREDEKRVAGLLDMKPIRIREVVTFYTMFFRKPVGRHHIQVCSNLSCSLAGGERLLDHLQKKLGIRSGGTTPDGRFTLTEVECLGACEQAPCMMVNFDYYGNLDQDKVEDILKNLS